MKRASKVLVLLLVAVLLMGLFCGCGFFTKDSVMYRSTAALQVGNETITIGKLIETFNNYYNNYYSYVSAGYITSDYLLEMTISSLYTQYMKLDAYKTDASVETYTHTNDLGLTNAEYLTDDELTYSIKYVKYLLFTNLDSLVEDYAAADGYTLDEEEEEDTSRDFVEYDELNENESYSSYILRQNLSSEEMDEYIEDYYDGIVNWDDLSFDGYVYTSEDAAEAHLNSLNERIPEDSEQTEISYAEYVEWQRLALLQYQKNVYKTYKYDLATLIEQQMGDMIISVIIAKYDYNTYKVIDNDNLSETISALKNTYEALRLNQEAMFDIDTSFVDYIEDLDDDSYVLTVPDGYDYIYVKNILIPFTDSQTALLTNIGNKLGSTDGTLYTEYRNILAADIIADDYTSEQDSDGEYTKIEGLFTLDDNGNVVINQDAADTSLSSILSADGTVKGDTQAEKDANIIELMKKFNTDTAQHSTIYDYVVRVGDNIPDSYSSSWVTEFVEAAQSAYELGQGCYSICVSSYGIHIVYYSAKVEAQQIDFDSVDFTNLDTTSPAYRMFKTYFEAQESILEDDALDALKKTYYKTSDSEAKIVKLDGFDTFINDNGFTFDFDESIEYDEED